MKSIGTGAIAVRIVSLGHALFALTLVWLGLMGLRHGAFTAIWSGVPKSLPGRPAVAYLCAAICLLGGLGVLWRRTSTSASRLLLGYWVLWMLAFRLPLLIRMPASSGVWWACGETAVMMGAAWVLYAWFGSDAHGGRADIATGDRGLRIARALYGLGLIPFGIAHFTFLQRTVGMVPGYLPWHLAWAYATGITFIAAGLAIVTGAWARLAATLSAWQMGLFTLLVWVPVVVKGASAADWNEFVDSVALTAAGWIVADSYARRRAPGGA
jgi:uncharacterized membrane protein